MGQQPLVPRRELGLILEIVDRGAERVGTMLSSHSAQLPQCVLQTLRQTLEALAKADRARLPIRIREREVIEQMRKQLPRYRHSQLSHVSEVAL